MKKHLYIINEHADKYKGHLEPLFPEVIFHAARKGHEVEDVISEIEILIASRDATTEELIMRASGLRWIQCLISGMDHLLALKSLKQDVLLTSARGIHGPQMSEMAFLHMINLTRNYPLMLRNQDQETWERWPQSLLYGKTVGILGIGVIAEELALKCKAFNMTVYGISSTEREVDGINRFFPRKALSEVAALVDYLIILIPHSPETEKIVNRDVIESMKPTAYLINIARGGVLDEKALIEALDSGKIAGAGLDVFREEPLPKGHPFWKMKNITMTPKVGGMTDIYPDQVFPILETNLRHFLDGDIQDMINIVRREKE